MKKIKKGSRPQGVRIGIVGAGGFSKHFIPLFKAHPEVEQVVLCDLDSEKLQKSLQEHGLTEASPSLDHLCGMDVDAIAIFTQNDRHAPHAMQALLSGKHVYSAVPSAITLEEMQSLVKTVESTKRIYMIGETSYYYPCALYCRERYTHGDFGRVVYCEGEYFHDFDHGLYDVHKRRFGDKWKEFSGLPPMLYPTHSTSLVVSVTGAHMTKVSCLGFVDDHEDKLFGDGRNIWNNSFSNQSALFQMSDGSAARINEFRRVGHPGEVRMSMYGTQGCYEEQYGNKVWVTKKASEAQDLTARLECLKQENLKTAQATAEETISANSHLGSSSIHPIQRLPKEFMGLPNGHNGSHQFLVDDFVQACVTQKTPPNNVWMAARYVIPGLIAHESAVRGGELLDVPDLGSPPSC